MNDAVQAVLEFTSVAERLLREVERLRRDVTKLDSRFARDEGEGDSEPWIARVEHRKRWSVGDALNAIETGRALIQACEYDLASIRSKLDDDVQLGSHGPRMIVRNVRQKR